MEMSHERRMNVVLISDDNYAMPTIVAITSLKLNKEVQSQYTVHVICTNMSEHNISLLKSLDQSDFVVDIIVMDNAGKYHDLIIGDLHVSPAALYKFDIANIFSELDRILYVDGDILFEKDPKELFEIDLSDNYAAVVKDAKPATYKPPQVVKLGIPHHSAYFNSGVMMLNLKKFREDFLDKRLLEYRKNGINYFMDQDALNVCFEEKVIYLSLYFNVMSSVIGFFTGEDIQKYYELDTSDKSVIYERAVIVHLCTRYKPWDYSNVPYADKWYYCYQQSPCDGELKREILSASRFKTFDNFDLGDGGDNEKEINISRSAVPEVIVSLTSYPARIGIVHFTVESLLNQTRPADKILLWLAKEQFPNGMDDLPNELKALESGAFSIRWCDMDLRCHKKYYYTMKEYPQSIVITADDDVVYDRKLLETLLISYRKFPFAVSCMRAHEIVYNNGKLADYNSWKRNSKRIYQPSMGLLPTGVGGVLYPPHAVNEAVFDANAIHELCLNADDLWLRVMSIINNTPVVVAGVLPGPTEIEGSQDTALWKTNDKQGDNDIQIRGIISRYNEFYGKSDTIINRMMQNGFEAFDKDSQSGGQNEVRLRKRIKALEKENAYLSSELDGIWRSASMKIGRFFTFIPRQIRSFIRGYITKTEVMNNRRKRK